MRVTTNHEEIRYWAERVRSKPQFIDDPSTPGDTLGLRLDLPGKNDDTMLHDPVRNISWEEFFEEFERQELAFEYEDIINVANPAKLLMSYRFIKRKYRNLGR